MGKGQTADERRLLMAEARRQKAPGSTALRHCALSTAVSLVTEIEPADVRALAGLSM